MTAKGEYKLSEDKVKIVVALYSEGLSTVKIATIVSVSIGTVRNVLLREGVVLRSYTPEQTPQGTKRCTKCKECKLFEAFSVSRRTRTGRCDRCKACQKQYVTTTKERRSVVGKQWRQSNRARRVATEMRRRAKKQRATPTWADNSAILKFYETAQGLSMLLGEWYHVDHIVPLTSDFVCGLHCEANLQVMLGADNCAKQNLWWPDMWEPTTLIEDKNVE